MAYYLTPMGKSLLYRMRLENPCDIDSPEFAVWGEWAFFGTAEHSTAPNDCDPPSAHEGWEWGRKFREEWK